VLCRRLTQKDRFGGAGLTSSGYWSPGGFGGRNSDRAFLAVQGWQVNEQGIDDSEQGRFHVGGAMA